MSQKDLQLIW